MFILEACGTDLFVQEQVSFAAAFFMSILFKSRKTQGEKINMFVHPGRT